ncbi:MAG: NifB/NifX family molybdenum-iron cluster-binding protein [Ignavibacteriaceae bacterium]|nr:NifB/NifX family molybdenum-iron cluster-binding protein [Ignavibacteriaceae bacterium]
MKIAIESNDGITIKSPFIPTKGYVVYDVKESDIVASEYRESNLRDKKPSGEKVIVPTKIRSLLSDCSTIISRGMDRSNLDVLKQEGMDVFITFKTSTKDAVRVYMRELLITSKLAH